jgi:hypothetical protein
MRVWQMLRRLLPWGLVGLQVWLFQRLMRRHGTLLLDQERLLTEVERLEGKAQIFWRSDATPYADRLRASRSTETLR